MSIEPSVSVIIPTYNRAGLLPTAIQSVLGQSYPHVEIIVVDDGSTDETKTVLKLFREKITYLTTAHGGPAHARNVGMKAAAGKYIGFLDSDDTYLPYKLEIQVAFMEDHPEAGMVYTEFSAYEKGVLDEFHLQNYHLTYVQKGWNYDDLFPLKGELLSNTVDRPITYYIGDIFSYILRGTIIPSPTILFPKKILEVVGFQNKNYRLGEDYEFVVRICKHFQVAFLNISTYVHYYHAGQMNPSLDMDGADGKEGILKEIEVYNVLLKAVKDWAYQDKEYYKKNTKLVNFRLAELYCEIGEKWLEYGDQKKARKSFQRSYNFASGIKARIFWWFSFMPSILRRFIYSVKIKLGARNLLK